MSTDSIEQEVTPFVSVLVICKNESRHIKACLEGLLRDPYPKDRIEFLVLDGMSEDGTREIVAELVQDHPNLLLIDNPTGQKPHGMNIGIAKARGEVIVRIDAHAFYQSEYISRLVSGLSEHGADNIGAIRETEILEGALNEAVCRLVSNKFAVGNAVYRTPDGKSAVRKVDTVFCGCYRREVFHKVGLYNEKLLRTQDRELNYRLASSGGTILLDPSIKCSYVPRTKLREYLKWIYTGGFWVFYARRFTKTKMCGWRNYVPAVFVVYLVAFSVVLLFFAQLILWLALPLALYLALSLAFALREPAPLKVRAVMVPLFWMTHVAYGTGAIAGLITAMIRGQDQWTIEYPDSQN